MIAPSGKVKKYGKEEILDVACADNDVYNECRRRMVSGKRDGEAGSVFAYESVIEYESFSNQMLFHFQNSSPVRLARFLITTPAGWEIKSSSFNGAPPEPARAGGTYTWQMENLPALERERRRLEAAVRQRVLHTPAAEADQGEEAAAGAPKLPR